MVPFRGERSVGAEIDGNEDVEGSEAVIGAGAFCVSADEDCASNSGGGTCVHGKFYQPVNHYQDRVTGRALGVASPISRSASGSTRPSRRRTGHPGAAVAASSATGLARRPQCCTWLCCPRASPLGLRDQLPGGA
jgi:hypothetical protein